MSVEQTKGKELDRYRDAVRQDAIKAFEAGEGIEANPYDKQPFRSMWFHAYEDASQIDWVEQFA